jgi:hypothetical protein
MLEVLELLDVDGLMLEDALMSMLVLIPSAVGYYGL